MLEQNQNEITEQNQNETWWQEEEQTNVTKSKAKTTDFQENLVTLDYIPEACLDWDDEYLWTLQTDYNAQTERLEQLFADIKATPDSHFARPKARSKVHNVIMHAAIKRIKREEAKEKEEQAYKDFLKNEFE